MTVGPVGQNLFIKTMSKFFNENKNATQTACPLCNSDRAGPSWYGSTIYLEKTFVYLQCSDCLSLYCSPMPDKQTLGRMYNAEYVLAPETHEVSETPPDPEYVLQRLRHANKGVFIDYGCGRGDLLKEAQQLGWEVTGIEFNQAVADRISSMTKISVSTPDAFFAKPSRMLADVIHLGDVLEHLTNANAQIPRILSLLRPGGRLIAQGPLEANTSLFNMLVRMSKSFRRRTPSNMPPYHVMLATAVGQKKLFERFGLRQEHFFLSEVSWPAPSTATAAVAMGPRSCAMFIARRLSQLCSHLSPQKLGNRYLYTGVWGGK